MGRRLDGRILRCIYQTRQATEGNVLTGFVVPGRTANAVRRNRLKRLLREAFRRERPALAAYCTENQTSLRMALLYRGRPDLPVDRVSFAHVREDVAGLCRLMMSRLKEPGPRR